MGVGNAVVILLLLMAGCARGTPEPPPSEPRIVAAQPDAPPPATQPAAPPPVAEPAAPPAVKPTAPPVAAQPVAPPVVKPAAPTPAAKPAVPATRQPEPAPGPVPPARAPAPKVPNKAAPPAAATSAAAATLDLSTLEAELRATKAIGFFTKITLKNQIDDLLDKFREYYQGKAKLTMTDLRRSYDLLLMKVLSLLQDVDPRLASAIVSSREAIWGLLADPKTFATLQG